MDPSGLTPRSSANRMPRTAIPMIPMIPRTTSTPPTIRQAFRHPLPDWAGWGFQAPGGGPPGVPGAGPQPPGWGGGAPHWPEGGLGGRRRRAGRAPAGLPSRLRRRGGVAGTSHCGGWMVPGADGGTEPQPAGACCTGAGGGTSSAGHSPAAAGGSSSGSGGRPVSGSSPPGASLDIAPSRLDMRGVRHSRGSDVLPSRPCDPVRRQAPARRPATEIWSTILGRGRVAQWQSKRLIIARSLVRIQPLLPPFAIHAPGPRARAFVRVPPKRGETSTVRERHRVHPWAMLERIRVTIGLHGAETGAARTRRYTPRTPPASPPACRTRRRSV